MRVTVYNYNIVDDNVEVGISSDVANNLHFQIKGDRPKFGTKVWLFGTMEQTSLKQGNITLGLTYLNKGDLDNDLMNEVDTPTITNFLEQIDDSAPEGWTQEDVINTLFTDGQVKLYETWIFRKVVLP